MILLGISLEVDLMTVDMTHYYKILGMDWLAANHAIIDCYKKEVVFTSPSKTTFKVKGTCLGTMPTVILMMKAKKLVKDRAWAILVNATNTKKGKNSPCYIVSGKRIPRCLPIGFTINSSISRGRF